MHTSITAAMVALIVLTPLVGSAKEKVFDRKALREGKSCKVLAAAQVAEAAALPAAAVSEHRAVKCMFTWQDGAAITTVSVHRSIDAARRYFAGLTAEASAEEMHAAKKLVQTELKKKAADGDLTRKEATKAGEVVEQMPKQDGAARGLSGVGDDAAVGDDGKVTVRVGNVTYQVAAKRGGSDTVDADLSQELARRVAANLERM